MQKIRFKGSLAASRPHSRKLRRRRSKSPTWAAGNTTRGHAATDSTKRTVGVPAPTDPAPTLRKSLLWPPHPLLAGPTALRLPKTDATAPVLWAAICSVLMEMEAAKWGFASTSIPPPPRSPLIRSCSGHPSLIPKARGTHGTVAHSQALPLDSPSPAEAQSVAPCRFADDTVGYFGESSTSPCIGPPPHFSSDIRVRNTEGQ